MVTGSAYGIQFAIDFLYVKGKVPGGVNLMSESLEKKVGDIMIPIRNYKIVSENCTVEDAVKVLYRSFYQRGKGGSGHKSIIVCDNNGNHLGLVDFRSILRTLEPRYAKFQKCAVSVFWEGLFNDKCKSQSVKVVKDIMQPIDSITLDANDPLIKAVLVMNGKKLDILPVKKNNRIVGMVRERELFEEAHNQMVCLSRLTDAIV